MILFSRRDSFGINLDQEYEHDQEYDRKINKSLKLHTEKKNATKTLRTQRFHQEKYKLCEDFESLCLSDKAFYRAMRNISKSIRLEI